MLPGVHSIGLAVGVPRVYLRYQSRLRVTSLQLYLAVLMDTCVDEHKAPCTLVADVPYDLNWDGSEHLITLLSWYSKRVACVDSAVSWSCGK